MPAAPARARRSDLRNIAIVAHVDHGKTTLVDNAPPDGHVPSERGRRRPRPRLDGPRAGERHHDPRQADDRRSRCVRLDIVGTPGHADFGGEVERSLLMVDSVLLLVDAAEGPLPQTRYVLQKAMARHFAGDRRHQQDRPLRRPGHRGPRRGLRAVHRPRCRHRQIDFPVLYTNAKAGTATTSLDEPGRDLSPLLDLLAEVTPPPSYEDGHPLQLLVTNLMANDYVGRMAVGRIWNGTIRTGQRISVVREEADDTGGTVEPGRMVTLNRTVTSLQTAKGIERVDIEEAGPGDIVSVAGLPEVTIGDTLTDPADPRPLPRLDVERADAPDDVRWAAPPRSPAARQAADQPPDQGSPRSRDARQRLDRGSPDRER